MPTALHCCQPCSPCSECPPSHVALPFLPWKVKLCFPSNKQNTWRTGVFNGWLDALCVLGASPLRESTQVGRAGIRGQGHLCITATETRPPPGSVTGLRESGQGSPLTTFVLPNSCDKVLLLSWVYSRRSPLSNWKIEGGAELLANTVGCEPAAIKVSLQHRRGCSSGFCWRSPWQEPPEKHSKDAGVFMEASGESHLWWNWCKIRHRSEVLFFFFSHHEKLILLPHTRLFREVSAAQVSCPPAGVGPKNRVGFSRWNRFRQINKVSELK